MISGRNIRPAMPEAQLCSSTGAQALADSDYDRIYILNMAEQGSQPRFDLVRTRYGKP